MIRRLSRRGRPTLVSAAAVLAATAATIPSPAWTQAEGAGEAPTVVVRAGRHGGYDRLVFNWPERVDYAVERDGSQVTFRFARDAQADLTHVRRVAPPRIEDIEPERTDRGLVVTIAVSEDAPIRHFRDRTGIVLDVLSGRAVASGSGARPADHAPAAPQAPQRGQKE